MGQARHAKRLITFWSQADVFFGRGGQMTRENKAALILFVLLCLTLLAIIMACTLDIIFYAQRISPECL